MRIATAALLLAGDAERAQEVGLCAVETAQRWGERGNEAWALCFLGDILASRQALPEARAHYEEALAIAEKLGMAPVRAQSSARLNRLA